MAGDMSALMTGGTPEVYVVANLSDAAACEQAMALLRQALPKDVPPAAPRAI